MNVRKSEKQKPKIIAEIGCNHKGNFNIAKELIQLAKECGADFAKFQKRNPKELLTPEQYNAPHPNPINSYGETYGKHREFLEFNQEQHLELKQHCETIGIEYSTSVWDVTSAIEIIELDPKYIKVPAATNNNFKMLEILRNDYKGEVHISFGMTTKIEEEEIIRFFEESGDARKRLVIYSCTSGYPVPYKDVCLLEINRLNDTYKNRVREIGFSGHHLGIAVDIAAFVLGAKWIERHFTKDKTWKGTDHSASLEPPNLKELIKNLNDVYQSLKYKCEEILAIENVQRKKLKFKK